MTSEAISRLLDDSELLVVLEVFREAFSTTASYEFFADKLDLHNDAINAILNKVDNHMENAAQQVN